MAREKAGDGGRKRRAGNDGIRQLLTRALAVMYCNFDGLAFGSESQLLDVAVQSSLQRLVEQIQQLAIFYRRPVW